jgi:hypothetical protein
MSQNTGPQPWTLLGGDLVQQRLDDIERRLGMLEHARPINTSMQSPWPPQQGVSRLNDPWQNTVRAIYDSLHFGPGNVFTDKTNELGQSIVALIEERHPGFFNAPSRKGAP